MNRGLRMCSIEFIYDPNSVQEWVTVLVDLLKEDLIHSVNTSKEVDNGQGVLE